MNRMLSAVRPVRLRDAYLRRVGVSNPWTNSAGISRRGSWARSATPLSFGLRPGRQLLRGMLAVVRRLLVAEPTLVPCRSHLLLVTKPLQVVACDVHPRRFRRGRWWMWGFGGHEAIVSVSGGEFRPRYLHGCGPSLGARTVDAINTFGVFPRHFASFPVLSGRPFRHLPGSQRFLRRVRFPAAPPNKPLTCWPLPQTRYRVSQRPRIRVISGMTNHVRIATLITAVTATAATSGS